MRCLLPLLVALAGCPQSSTDLAAVGDDDRAPPEGSAFACVEDTDCELAARTCCECPTFALGAGDPKLDACGGVACPPPQSTCSRLRPVCDARNQCTVACEPQPVTMSCDSGFATDAAGCLIDACAAPTGECAVDGDCVQTRADCCGCARGGTDTAVPAGALVAYDKALACDGSEVCPEVSTCVAAETAQCAQGTCKLVAGSLPADACGRPDLPPCASGTVCTVNASDVADLHGVGVCR